MTWQAFLPEGSGDYSGYFYRAFGSPTISTNNSLSTHVTCVSSETNSNLPQTETLHTVCSGIIIYIKNVFIYIKNEFTHTIVMDGENVFIKILPFFDGKCKVKIMIAYD